WGSHPSPDAVICSPAAADSGSRLRLRPTTVKLPVGPGTVVPLNRPAAGTREAVGASADAGIAAPAARTAATTAHKGECGRMGRLASCHRWRLRQVNGAGATSRRYTRTPE